MAQSLKKYTQPGSGPPSMASVKGDSQTGQIIVGPEFFHAAIPSPIRWDLNKGMTRECMLYTGLMVPAISRGPIEQEGPAVPYWDKG